MSGLYEEIPGPHNFMMLKAEESSNGRNSLNVILNWNEELKNRLANAN